MHRAVRSTATVRNANRIGRRMAGSRANVNGFLLGPTNGEGHGSAEPMVAWAVNSVGGHAAVSNNGHVGAGR